MGLLLGSLFVLLIYESAPSTILPSVDECSSISLEIGQTISPTFSRFQVCILQYAVAMDLLYMVFIILRSIPSILCSSGMRGSPPRQVLCEFSETK